MLLGSKHRVLIQDKACEACQKLNNPKAVNKVTIGTAVGTLLSIGENNTQTFESLMVALTSEIGKTYDSGPGTNLKKYLSWFASESDTCDCKNKAKIMNVWGPDVCLENIDAILEWLKQSAKEKKLPFVRFVAELLVRKAISEARSV